MGYIHDNIHDKLVAFKPVTFEVNNSLDLTTATSTYYKTLCQENGNMEE